MTGLIYVAIVALWAAVLIPMWLRRHDDDQARKVDRHRDAIGILARIRTSPRSGLSRAARRRRIVLAGLVAIAVAAAGGYTMEFVGLWAPVAAAALIVGFVAVASLSRRADLRRQADAALRRSAESRATRQAEREQVREEIRTSRRRAPARPAPVARSAAPRVRRPTREVAWEQVFDQTA